MEIDSLIGKTIHSNLLIKGKLGEGAMGEVYLAENINLVQKKYAVKVLRRELTKKPTFKERFYEEATHQAQLDHPNIVQMYDYFNVGEDYFIVLEYVDGKALSDIIDAQRGPLEEKQALTIMKGILAGLNCAHEKGILHRDVKSSNVMVDKSGRARLTDFGIAREVGERGRSEAGMSIGTAEYMSPEQIRNPDKVNHISDVYSAGIVLFEMLTGKLPFGGESYAAVQEQQIRSPIPDPRAINPKIGKRLARIICRAMQKDPNDRFQGCLEFLKTIDAYLNRFPAWVIMIFFVAALAVAGIYFYRTQIQAVTVIQGLITSATSNYGLLCRETKSLQGKENGLRIARESGNSRIAELLANQVEEIRGNMGNLADNYVKEISELSNYNGVTVQQVLSTIGAGKDADEKAAATETKEFYRARYRQLIGKDYEQYVYSRKTPPMETLLTACQP